MKIETTDEEVQEQQKWFKENYPPFVPYKFNQRNCDMLVRHWVSIVRTQNGMDTDDYCMNEHNKIHRYTKDIPRGSKILFLGTGTGREVAGASILGLDAYGLTLGSRNVFFGRSYLGIPGERLQEGLNESLPFENGSFDHVHGYQVFEHAVAPLIFLLEIGRVLKMGGQTLLEWPPGKDYTMDENPHHQICYTPGQAVALMKKAGFGNVEVCKDNGDQIPPEHYWSCEQTYMMVIRGIKVPPTQEHVQKAWSL